MLPLWEVPRKSISESSFFNIWTTKDWFHLHLSPGPSLTWSDLIDPISVYIPPGSPEVLELSPTLPQSHKKQESVEFSYHLPDLGVPTVIDQAEEEQTNLIIDNLPPQCLIISEENYQQLPEKVLNQRIDQNQVYQDLLSQSNQESLKPLKIFNINRKKVKFKPTLLPSPYNMISNYPVSDMMIISTPLGTTDVWKGGNSYIKSLYEIYVQRFPSAELQEKVQIIQSLHPLSYIANQEYYIDINQQLQEEISYLFIEGFHVPQGKIYIPLGSFPPDFNLAPIPRTYLHMFIEPNLAWFTKDPIESGLSVVQRQLDLLLEPREKKVKDRTKEPDYIKTIRQGLHSQTLRIGSMSNVIADLAKTLADLPQFIEDSVRTLLLDPKLNEAERKIQIIDDWSQQINTKIIPLQSLPKLESQIISLDKEQKTLSTELVNTLGTISLIQSSQSQLLTTQEIQGATQIAIQNQTINNEQSWTHLRTLQVNVTEQLNSILGTQSEIVANQKTLQVNHLQSATNQKKIEDQMIEINKIRAEFQQLQQDTQWQLKEDQKKLNTQIENLNNSVQIQKELLDTERMEQSTRSESLQLEVKNLISLAQTYTYTLPEIQKYLTIVQTKNLEYSETYHLTVFELKNTYKEILDLLKQKEEEFKQKQNQLLGNITDTANQITQVSHLVQQIPKAATYEIFVASTQAYTEQQKALTSSYSDNQNMINTVQQEIQSLIGKNNDTLQIIQEINKVPEVYRQIEQRYQTAIETWNREFQQSTLELMNQNRQFNQVAMDNQRTQLDSTREIIQTDYLTRLASFIQEETMLRDLVQDQLKESMEWKETFKKQKPVLEELTRQQEEIVNKELSKITDLQSFIQEKWEYTQDSFKEQQAEKTEQASIQESIRKALISDYTKLVKDTQEAQSNTISQNKKDYSIVIEQVSKIQESTQKTLKENTEKITTSLTYFKEQQLKSIEDNNSLRQQRSKTLLELESLTKITKEIKEQEQKGQKLVQEFSEAEIKRWTQNSLNQDKTSSILDIHHETLKKILRELGSSLKDQAEKIQAKTKEEEEEYNKQLKEQIISLNKELKDQIKKQLTQKDLNSILEKIQTMTELQKKDMDDNQPMKKLATQLELLSLQQDPYSTVF